MHHADPSLDSKRLWCLTLPLLEERPLTDEERRMLKRQLRRASVVAIFGFAVTPLSLFAMLMGLAMWGENTALEAVALIGGMVVTVVCCLQGYRRMKHARLAMRELRQGTVQRFAGELGDESRPDIATSIARFLTKAGFQLTGTQECVELYGGSGRLLRVNGKSYRGWDLILTRIETAHIPDFAAIAARWLQKVGETATGEAVYGGRRELSSEELAEMRQHAFAFWWRRPPRLLVLVALCLWPAVLVVIALVIRKPANTPLCWLLVIGLVSVRPIMRGVLFTWKLWRTVRTGVVMIFQYPENSTSGPSDDGSATSPMENKQVVIEVLPGTDIAWTINGKPAPWRRV